MKTIFVKVAVRVNDDADVDDVMQNCDYNFIHNQVTSTEIIDYSYEGSPWATC